MDTIAISELRAMAHEARALEEGARKQAERLERLLTSISDDAGKAAPGEDPFKRPDRRLTEAGIAAIEAAFTAGATVSQVAKQFDIQVSAASNRKKIWEAKAAAAR
jgi:hypothetical protein